MPKWLSFSWLILLLNFTTGDKKLAAVGIRVSQWITYHGLALNVNTDLTPFHSIVPCGIRNRQVGSIKGLLGEFQPPTGCGKAGVLHSNDCQLIDITHSSLIKEFSEVFQLEILHKTIPMSEFEDTTPRRSLTWKLTWQIQCNTFEWIWSWSKIVSEILKCLWD